MGGSVLYDALGWCSTSEHLRLLLFRGPLAGWHEAVVQQSPAQCPLPSACRCRKGGPPAGALCCLGLGTFRGLHLPASPAPSPHWLGSGRLSCLCWPASDLISPPWAASPSVLPGFPWAPHLWAPGRPSEVNHGLTASLLDSGSLRVNPLRPEGRLPSLA